MLDFQRKASDFEKRNIGIIAASADSLELALQTVEVFRLTFKVGYGLEARKVSALTGAFYHEKNNFLHATGFIVDPEAKVKSAVYSTRSIGRLVAKDCLEFIGKGTG